MPLQRLPQHAPESVPESLDTSFPHSMHKTILPYQDGPGNSQFTCRFCPLQLSNLKGIQRHEKRHQGKLECPYCPKRVPDRFSLSEHLRTHTDEKPFECDTCTKTYKRPQALKKHKENCPPLAQQPHQQDIAQNTPVTSNTSISESFSVRQGDDLVSTVDTPNDNVDTDSHGDTVSYNPPPIATEGFLVQRPPMPPAPTGDTNQGFYDNNLPIQTWPHQDQGTPRDPANQGKTCDVCGRAFRWAHDRMRHEKSHRPNELEFVCDGGCGKTGCGKAYSRRDTLLRHLSSSRNNQDGTSLARHKICHTDEGLKCPYCSLRPSTISSLAEHLRSHIHAQSFACAFCSCAYKYKHDLQKHAKHCLPPTQLHHQQNIAQNTPVASNTSISESFPVCQGEDLVSTVGTPNDNVDIGSYNNASIGHPPMATEGFLIQRPSVPRAPADGIDQGFYGDSLLIQTSSPGAYFCTNPWGGPGGPFLAPHVSVTTQQGMPAGQPENQEEGDLGTVYFNTSWVRI